MQLKGEEDVTRKATVIHHPLYELQNLDRLSFRIPVVISFESLFIVLHLTRKTLLPDNPDKGAVSDDHISKVVFSLTRKLPDINLFIESSSLQAYLTPKELSSLTSSLYLNTSILTIFVTFYLIENEKTPNDIKTNSKRKGNILVLFIYKKAYLLFYDYHF
eukprot:gene5117-3673_t